MARFHFSLDRVLRWYAVELSVEETRLKQLVQIELRLQAQRAAMNAERSKLAFSLGGMPDLSGADLRTMTVYSLRLRRQAETLAQQLAQCQRDLAAQRKKYHDAKRRLRLVEELKKRRLAEWQYEQAREIEELASESYLANWNRSHT